MPATADSEQGTYLAHYRQPLHEDDWIDGLLKAGLAIDLGGMAPELYTLQAQHLLPRVIKMRADEVERAKVPYPGALTVNEWRARSGMGPVEDGDLYSGVRTYIDQNAVDDCRPDEWLLVEKIDADWG